MLNFPNSTATPHEQRIANALGGADAGYPLTHYFRVAEQSGTPINVRIPASALTARRDLTAGVATAGGYLVQTSNIGPASFIEGYPALAGAQVISGLTGPITIPRITTLPATQWIAEGATITESQPTFQQLALTPFWMTMVIDVSRQLSLQNPAAGPILLSIIAEQFRLSLIEVMLGIGGAARPTGLAGIAGTNAVSGASLGASGVRDMAEGVLNAGGRLDRISWFARPAVWKLLNSREYSAGSGRPVADVDGILGRPVYPVSQAPASTLLAVDMSRVVIGIFDGLGAQISVDPYSSTNFRSGVVSYRLMVGVDIGALTPSAVSVATSVT